MTTTSSKRKKAVVATATAAALLLGGTFAWTSISQTALNEAIVDINPGGRLHDDFNGQNKDVYVENFNDKDDPTAVSIYARVRLDEYMEIGQDAGKDPDTLNGEEKKALTVKNPTGEFGEENVGSWQTYMPTADSLTNEANVSSEFWTLSWGNDDTDKYYMPTFNKNKDSLAADRNGTYEGTIEGDIVHYDDYKEYKADTDTKNGLEYYDWDSNTLWEGPAGTADYEYNLGVGEYPVQDMEEAKSIPIDDCNVVTMEDTHNAKQISTTATVITMTQWLENPVPGDYWVYDETDGWAYWANPIAPGETTGLFLSGIQMHKVPDDNWYYGINVVGEFVTESDLLNFAPSSAPSANAAKLLELAAKAEKATVVANADDLQTAFDNGEDVVLSGTVTTTETAEHGLNFASNALMTGGTLSGGGLDMNGNAYAGLFINAEDNWPGAGDVAAPSKVKDTAITADTTVVVYAQPINADITLDRVDITGQYTGFYAEYGPGTATLNNVNVEVTGPDNIEGYDWYNSAVAAANGANVVINGGSYKAPDYGNAVHIFSSGGTITINDGDFVGGLKVDKGSLIIKGGTFTVDPTAYVAEGYQATDNGDGTWTVAAV